MLAISIHALLAESDKPIGSFQHCFLISIHALLAESDPFCEVAEAFWAISIHALLAESDNVACGDRHKLRDFYPRSPCGERPIWTVERLGASGFLSTLSLRRATCFIVFLHFATLFLSTLSLRRATSPNGGQYSVYSISIHALLAESDLAVADLCQRYVWISIHALLAESDGHGVRIAEIDLAFLSTLSLRRATHAPNRRLCRCNISIHALLAESDNIKVVAVHNTDNFYPRSPCGERLMVVLLCHHINKFLSTLSLRRATQPRVNHGTGYFYFYPRSPCGERHIGVTTSQQMIEISIHALLAESDCVVLGQQMYNADFYPRSPCGERPAINALGAQIKTIFLSTLSLRRATMLCGLRFSRPRDFYPRSPCGERRDHPAQH